MKNKLITKTINQWDPIGLISMHSPNDEYSCEIRSIINMIEKTNHINTHSVAKIVYDVFSFSFGNDVFTNTLSECERIAEDIIDIWISNS